MKQIAPFKSLDEALSNLDNGGRFYNILTEPNDGIISSAELGKIAGMFNDKQKMILFLELSMSELNPGQKDEILSKLEDRLKQTYQKYKPQHLLPSQASTIGIVSSNTIITGTPTLIDTKSGFSGFIMVPIVAGKVITFSMIPIIEKYDVYELRDEVSNDQVLIAHLKESKKLPKEKIKVAGVLKELNSKEDYKGETQQFLEVIYHL